jgi:hypothetical protein
MGNKSHTSPLGLLKCNIAQCVLSERGVHYRSGLNKPLAISALTRRKGLKHSSVPLKRLFHFEKIVPPKRSPAHSDVKKGSS